MHRRLRDLALGTSGVVLAVAMCAACTGSPTPAPPPGPPISTSSDFYVDPDTPASIQVLQWADEGRSADAEQLRKISERPQAAWPTGDVSQVNEQVALYIERATTAQKRPLLVMAGLPDTGCVQAASADAYRGWLAGFVGGLGDASATVVVEPGAVTRALTGCTDPDARSATLGLLSEAVAALGSSGSKVYLDAGTPVASTDLDALATALRAAGVEQAAGFSLNVGDIRSTEDSVTTGRQLSDRLDGKHFLVDTSRNGSVPDAPTPSGDAVCNPPGRALGTPPTAQTGDDRLDALVWIKRPGESDGACRPGEPAAGEFWPEYALGLAQRSTT